MVMQLSIKLGSALALLGEMCILSPEEFLSPGAHELCPGAGAGAPVGGWPILPCPCARPGPFSVTKAAFQEQGCSVGQCPAAVHRLHFTAENTSSGIKKSPSTPLSLYGCELFLPAVALPFCPGA